MHEQHYRSTFQALTQAFKNLNLMLEQNNTMTHDKLSQNLHNLASCANSLVEIAHNKDHYHLAILCKMLEDILKLAKLNNIQIEMEIGSKIKYTFYHLHLPSTELINTSNYKNSFIYTCNKLFKIDSVGKIAEIPITNLEGLSTVMGDLIYARTKSPNGYRYDFSYEEIKYYIMPYINTVINFNNVNDALIPLKIESTPMDYRKTIYDSSSNFFTGMWHAATRSPLNAEEQKNLVDNLKSCLDLNEDRKINIINKIKAEYEETSSCLSPYIDSENNSSSTLLDTLNSGSSTDEKWYAINSYMLKSFSEKNKLLENNGKKLFIAVYDAIKDEMRKNNQIQENLGENTPLIFNIPH